MSDGNELVVTLDNQISFPTQNIILFLNSPKGDVIMVQGLLVFVAMRQEITKELVKARCRVLAQGLAKAEKSYNVQKVHVYFDGYS